MNQDITQKQIEAFQNRFGEPHLQLAFYAAFPLGLTPDLLYRLRDRFEISVPWLAIFDLLSSNLCYESGNELYFMNQNVRQRLLQSLDETQLKQLSDFLLDYVDRHLKHSKGQTLAQAQRWTALAYTEPNKTAKELAKTLNQLLETTPSSEWLQKATFIETIAPKLIEAKFEPLLTLSRGMAQTAKGNFSQAKELFEELSPTESANIVNIAGISINLPQAVRAKRFTFDTPTVNRKGEIIKTQTYTAKYFSEQLEKSTDKEIILDMVYIPGGTFTMGSPKSEKDSHNDERPQHNVTVPPFFMGKYPVTQAQWKAIASRTDLKVKIDLKLDPSNFKQSYKDQDREIDRWQRPVEEVNWYEAVEFCQRLSKLTRRHYRLPSEAEWEYACRSVNSEQLSVISEKLAIEEWNQKYNQPFHFGETITGDLANYSAQNTYAEEPKGQYRQQTTPVGQFPPNAFGLYDMHGNVWEWCADDWHDNYEGAPTDGIAWLDSNQGENVKSEKDSYSGKNDDNSSYSVLRGGSWGNYPNNCRSAFRVISLSRDNHNYNLGFRLVCLFGITLYSESWQVRICQECAKEFSLLLRCWQRYPEIKLGWEAW
ncbi:formylglycine-generating enzyme family protein [Aphanothece sacrum]|uniref:Sulfatase-modifying factor enzyme-like domain-containing protein n=1 Tax=Aphanothece sacrum FPU1 TaxID=1920663 RepID=A0A401IIK2_APHSA|nr:formylglycine-generating enzyme family protein [Aphanothece sacrum]GBF81155.1 hypothetical protein AsFPU1_2567 [Aphanothece sacrum FPU1]GBF83497.1 hypothetical protein AsFPU3_0539 [Aphanothece sacrum FPU3]